MLLGAEGVWYGYWQPILLGMFFIILSLEFEPCVSFRQVSRSPVLIERWLKSEF